MLDSRGGGEREMYLSTTRKINRKAEKCEILICYLASYFLQTEKPELLQSQTYNSSNTNKPSSK